jgi:aspartate aminotransferase
MFMFPGKQVAYLAKEYHMYLLPNGRANLCVLNNGNLDRFAHAVHDAVTMEAD